MTMSNPGAYFEIAVTDMERARRFYAEVMGYTFTTEIIHGNEMAILPFQDTARGITGALAKGTTYVPSLNGTLIYLSTSNIDATLKKATTSGGSILFPRTAAGDYGYVAELKDSEGNRIGLFESK